MERGGGRKPDRAYLDLLVLVERTFAARNRPGRHGGPLTSTLLPIQNSRAGHFTVYNQEMAMLTISRVEGFPC